MKRFRVVEGRLFRKTVAERTAGLIGFDDRLEELKLLLERNPIGIGRRENEEFPRYIIAIDAGILDWQILVEYFIREDEVELLQVM